MKTHWLFGSGPDKTIDFNRDVDANTDCGACVHREVCDRDTEKRCENFKFGTSPARGCAACNHRFTRFDSTPVPCFSCPWFQAGDPAYPQSQGE